LADVIAIADDDATIRAGSRRLQRPHPHEGSEGRLSSRWIGKSQDSAMLSSMESLRGSQEARLDQSLSDAPQASERVSA